MNESEINHNLQNYDDSKSYISKNKEKIIIFLATSFFSIHTLVYILKFKLNFPFGDDGQASSFAYEYLATGSWDDIYESNYGWNIFNHNYHLFGMFKVLQNYCIVFMINY